MFMFRLMILMTTISSSIVQRPTVKGFILFHWRQGIIRFDFLRDQTPETMPWNGIIIKSDFQSADTVTVKRYTKSKINAQLEPQ